MIKDSSDYRRIDTSNHQRLDIKQDLEIQIIKTDSTRLAEIKLIGSFEIAHSRVDEFSVELNALIDKFFLD